MDSDGRDELKVLPGEKEQALGELRLKGCDLNESAPVDSPQWSTTPGLSSRIEEGGDSVPQTSLWHHLRSLWSANSQTGVEHGSS